MNNMVEPWLRNTHRELDAVRRQVIHALELTGEDCARWCECFSTEQLNLSLHGIPSVAFQMRHIVRSLDRLLTYAEDRSLDDVQRALLASEHEWMEREFLFAEFQQGMLLGMERVLRMEPTRYEDARFVGRERLPTTCGALLIHCAEHTQRHSGQMVTTAKLVQAVSRG